MIKAQKGIILTLIAACVTAIGIGIYCMLLFLFGVSDYLFVIDSAFAPDIQKTIVQRIQQASCVTAGSVHEQLQSLGLDVQTLTVTRYATKTAVVEVATAPACAWVNKETILTASGALIDHHVFNPIFTQRLPRIAVAPGYQLTSADKQWLLTWLPTLSSRYIISFVHDHEIYLQDKKDIHWHIVCARGCQFNQPLFDRIAQVKEKIMEKMGTKYRRGSDITADIRFEKQIIIGGNRGGVIHG